jgi:hypothetical protein
MLSEEPALKSRNASRSKDRDRVRELYEALAWAHSLSQVRCSRSHVEYERRLPVRQFVVGWRWFLSGGARYFGAPSCRIALKGALIRAELQVPEESLILCALILLQRHRDSL